MERAKGLMHESAPETQRGVEALGKHAKFLGDRARYREEVREYEERHSNRLSVPGPPSQKGVIDPYPESPDYSLAYDAMALAMPGQATVSKDPDDCQHDIFGW